MQTLLTKRSCSVLILLVFVLAGSGWADVKPMVKQTFHGVAYITGGVGLDERAELRKLFKDYTCRIELANKKGEYLYKARICILDSKRNEVLETDTCGPWLLVDLAEGDYTAIVVHNGKEKNVKISVRKGKKKAFVVNF